MEIKGVNTRRFSSSAFDGAREGSTIQLRSFSTTTKDSAPKKSALSKNRQGANTAHPKQKTGA